MRVIQDAYPRVMRDKTQDLGTSQGKASYPLRVPITSYPLVGIETPRAPRAASAGSNG
jgi:hypothetical protein